MPTVHDAYNYMVRIKSSAYHKKSDLCLAVGYNHWNTRQHIGFLCDKIRACPISKPLDC